MDGPDPTRREFLKALGAAAAAAALPSGARGAEAPGVPSPGASDRVFVVAEDSSTLVVVDPARNAVDTDVSEPLAPRFVAQVPLGALALPSGELRHRRGGALVYVRPGHRASGG